MTVELITMLFIYVVSDEKDPVAQMNGKMSGVLIPTHESDHSLSYQPPAFRRYIHQGSR